MMHEVRVHRRDLEDPYELYRTVRTVGGVARDVDRGDWVVGSYEAVRSVLTRHDVFSSVVGPLAALHGDPDRSMLIASDLPRHTRLRAAASLPFRPANIGGWRAAVEVEAERLVGTLVADRRVDIAASLAEPLPIAVIARLLGVPDEQRTAFKAWSDGFINGLNEARWELAIEPSWTNLRSWFADALATRSIAPTDDLLSELAAQVDAGDLDLDEAIDLGVLLLLAGNETTSNLLANTVALLCDRPDLQARLRSDPDAIPRAIEEVLRWDSPVQALFRVALEDTELEGHRILAGERLLVLFGSANRDESQFDRADQVDLDREAQPHLAFGQGRHFCLGVHLARLEANVGIAALLAGTKNFTHDLDGAPSRRATPVVRGWLRLPIVVEPD